jgi:hypothetical protein
MTQLIDHDLYENLKNIEARSRCCSVKAKEVEGVDHITLIEGFMEFTALEQGETAMPNI